MIALREHLAQPWMTGSFLGPAGYPAAAPNDYRFELVDTQPTGPGKTNVTVRLVHMPDKKPVPGAVRFESKTDMGPGGMPEMPGKVSALSPG